MLFTVVGTGGFEPPTPWTQTRYATRLRYAPLSHGGFLSRLTKLSKKNLVLKPEFYRVRGPQHGAGQPTFWKSLKSIRKGEF